jgi:hypothetical protein
MRFMQRMDKIVLLDKGEDTDDLCRKVRFIRTYEIDFASPRASYLRTYEVILNTDLSMNGMYNSDVFHKFAWINTQSPVPTVAGAAGAAGAAHHDIIMREKIAELTDLSKMVYVYMSDFSGYDHSEAVCIYFADLVANTDVDIDSPMVYKGRMYEVTWGEYMEAHKCPARLLIDNLDSLDTASIWPLRAKSTLRALLRRQCTISSGESDSTAIRRAHAWAYYQTCSSILAMNGDDGAMAGIRAQMWAVEARKDDATEHEMVFVDLQLLADGYIIAFKAHANDKDDFIAQVEQIDGNGHEDWPMFKATYKTTKKDRILSRACALLAFFARMQPPEYTSPFTCVASVDGGAGAAAGDTVIPFGVSPGAESDAYLGAVVDVKLYRRARHGISTVPIDMRESLYHKWEFKAVPVLSIDTTDIIILTDWANEPSFSYDSVMDRTEKETMADRKYVHEVITHRHVDSDKLWTDENFRRNVETLSQLYSILYKDEAEYDITWDYSVDVDLLTEKDGVIAMFIEKTGYPTAPFPFKERSPLSDSTIDALYTFVMNRREIEKDRNYVFRVMNGEHIDGAMMAYDPSDNDADRRVKYAYIRMVFEYTYDIYTHIRDYT